MRIRAGILAFATGVVVALVGSGVCGDGPAPSAAASSKAAPEFAPRPVGDHGFVFVEGKYLDSPYTVTCDEGWLAINHVRIRQLCQWPIQEPDMSKPKIPEELMKNAKSFDDLILPGGKDSWCGRMARWIQWTFPDPDEQNAECKRFYESLPFVREVTFPDNGTMTVSLKNGENKEFGLDCSHRPMSQAETRQLVEYRLQRVAEPLAEGATYLFFAKYPELSLTAAESARDLQLMVEVLGSARATAEKVRILERMGMQTPSSDKMLALLVANFTASPQLTQRIAALPASSGIQPWTLAEVPERSPNELRREEAKRRQAALAKEAAAQQQPAPARVTGDEAAPAAGKTTARAPSHATHNELGLVPGRPAAKAPDIAPLAVGDHGFVFIDGKYLDRPYAVSCDEGWLAVNHIRVRDLWVWQVREENPPKPEIPPEVLKNAKSLQDLFTDEWRDSWDRRMARWLDCTCPDVETRNAELKRFYESLPFVREVTFPNARHVSVTETNGIIVGFPIERASPALTEAGLRRLVEGDVQRVAEKLAHGGTCLLFGKGPHLSLTGAASARDLYLMVEVLGSDRPTAEKVSILQRMGIAPQEGKESLLTLVTSFTASPQLAQRIAALQATTGIPPRTLADLPQRTPLEIREEEIRRVEAARAKAAAAQQQPAGPAAVPAP